MAVWFQEQLPLEGERYLLFCNDGLRGISPYFVARIADKRLIPMTRSSRGTYRMVGVRRASPPSKLCPVTDPLAQTHRLTSGYLI